MTDVDGNPAGLDDLLARPLAVPLVRYYGCADAGAFTQAAVAVPAFGVALWRVRHNKEIRTFVIGLAITFAWFALRTLH